MGQGRSTPGKGLRQECHWPTCGRKNNELEAGEQAGRTLGPASQSEELSLVRSAGEGDDLTHIFQRSLLPLCGD